MQRMQRMNRQRTVRLPDALWERVEGWTQAVSAEVPGDQPNESEALRRLLLIALESEDRRRAKKAAKASTSTTMRAS